MPGVSMRVLWVELGYSRLQTNILPIKPSSQTLGFLNSVGIKPDIQPMVEAQQYTVSGCMHGDIAQNLNFLNGSPKG